MSQPHSSSASSASGKHHDSSREHVGGRQAGGENGSSGHGSGDQARRDHGLARHDQAGGDLASCTHALHEHTPHEQPRNKRPRREQTIQDIGTGGNTTGEQIHLQVERAGNYLDEAASDGIAHHGGSSSGSSNISDANSEEKDIGYYLAIVRESLQPEAALADEQALYDTSDEGNSPSENGEVNDEAGSHRERENDSGEDEGIEDDDGEDDNGMSHYKNEHEDDADYGAKGHSDGDQEEDDDAIGHDQGDYDERDYENECGLEQDDYEDGGSGDEDAPVPDDSRNYTSEQEYGDDMTPRPGLRIEDTISDFNADDDLSEQASASASEDSEVWNSDPLKKRRARMSIMDYGVRPRVYNPYSGKHKKHKHHHRASETEADGSNRSDSSLSELGSTPPPPNRELLAIARAQKVAEEPFCACTGWCSCEKYSVFVGSGEEALRYGDQAEKDDACFPSQTHLPEHVLASEQIPLSAMRSTINDNTAGDICGSMQSFSWDSLPKPRRAPVNWAGGEWNSEY